MPEAHAATAIESRFKLLLRVRARATVNRLRQAVDEAPLRVFATGVLVVVIWVGLWALFELVFYQIRRTPLEATVAIPLVFNFFFVAMLVLLTFSNALISYGTLFARAEASYLLASPLRPGDVVSLKYVESLVLSSWSLFVLGLPLMLAIARQSDDLWFYPLFIAFFLAFIPIPGALGMLLAWGAARFFPRNLARTAVIVGAVVLVGFVLWGLQLLNPGQMAHELWLRTFFAKMSFVESALMPNNWVARGIENAKAGKLAVSTCYLCVTLANALLLSWLAVLIVSRGYERAFDRAAAARGRELVRQAQRVRASGGPAGWVFFYLPTPLRLIAAKDLRTFLRDPLQWGQLVILFGLMMLYLANVPTLHFRVAGSGWELVIPFLNLSAISLILATFTCRFVFPLVSLEGQKLWLIGLLPMPRSRILIAKFAFALTVTLSVAWGAMGLSVIRLELGLMWSLIHLTVASAVCFGLCGFAVGIGARLPLFDQTNVARIANGFGGTTNLLASVTLVTLVLSGVALATWRSRYLDSGELPDAVALLACGGAVLLAVGAGCAAMAVGARHFQRVEV